MADYEAQNTLKFTFTFTDTDGNNADPASVEFRLRYGTTTDEYTLSDLTKSATGIYYILVPLAAAMVGTVYWTCEVPDEDTPSSVSGYFTVYAQRVLATS